ncbi:MAG TPA: RluA family pseudouridine synthase [Acidobacteriota bacterium]|nr:RluA family pseudouridine synthase [Acidobacteriota bacterium]
MSDLPASWIVASDRAGIRLDRFMTLSLPDESRSQMQNWIRKGHVTVNGKTAKTGYITRTGDHVELRLPATEPGGPFPEEIPLTVLYEDDDLAVIDKPAGMICHTGAGIKSGTLVNALLYRMGSLEAGDPARPGIVHRLDKFTSGVLLVAKNNFAHRRLSEQFKKRQVRKHYLALIYGSLSPPRGTIDLAIGRDPDDRKKMSPRAGHKRNAVTHYSLKTDYGTLSLLDIRIETGRTHQIRVHLAWKGHPVVGDILYGGNRFRNLSAPLMNEANKLGRLFLHASRLEFIHPRSEKQLSFCAPLPEELQHFLVLIEKQLSRRAP